MALDSQLVHVSLDGGLQQHTDAHHLQPGKMQSLVNGRFDKAGAVRKRAGFSVLTSTLGGSAMSAGVGRLLAIRGELLVCDGKTLGSYSPQLGSFVKKDKLPEALGTRSPVSGAATRQHTPDSATGSGVVVHVWAAGSTSFGKNDIYVSVVDPTTGAEFFSSRQVATGAAYVCPRVCYVAATSTFFIVYNNTTTQLLNATTYVHSTQTFANITAVGAGATVSTNSVNIAVCANPGADRIYILFCNGTRSELDLTNTAGANIAFRTAYDGIGLRYAPAVAINPFDSSVWIVWSAANTTYAATYALGDAMIAGLPQTGLYFGGAGVNIGTSGICFTGLDTIAYVAIGAATNAGATAPFVALGAINTAGTISISPANRITYWSTLGSVPFFYLGRLYAWAYVGGANYGSIGSKSSQYSYMLLDLVSYENTGSVVPARPVCVVAPRICAPDSDGTGILVGAAGGFAGSLASVYQPSTGKFSCQGRIRNGATLVNVFLATADFSNTSLWGGAELGQDMYLSGGMTSYYDGRSVAEVGFSYYPENMIITATAGGGMTNATTGSYSYIAVYEYMDERGLIHRSIPSPPVTVLLGVASGNKSVTIKSAGYCVTNRQNFASGYNPAVQTVYYRTSEGGGSVYRRVGSDPDQSILNTSVLPQNDPRVVEYAGTFSDGQSDASMNLLSPPQIYISGGVVSNVMPPSMGSIVSYRNRLWGIGDDTRTLWYSKQLSEGEAISFADEFTLTLERQGASVLTVLDGSLVAMAPDRIYTIVGDGPADTSAGNDISSPQRVATDFGCVEPRSVVSTPDGIYFQSSIGIYLLGRDLNVSYRGMDAEDAYTANPVVTSAIIHPFDSHYVFTCVNPSSGVRICQDSISDQWCMDQVLGTARILSSVVSGGTVYILTDQGTVYQETPNTYTDAGVFVPTTWEFAAIKLADLQGYQRVWNVGLIGDRYTSHQLTMSIATDDSPIFTQVHTFSDPFIDSQPLERLRLHIRKQLCSTLRVKVVDSAPLVGALGTGRGMSLAGLAFECGVMKRAARIPPSAVG